MAKLWADPMLGFCRFCGGKDWFGPTQFIRGEPSTLMMHCHHPWQADRKLQNSSSDISCLLSKPDWRMVACAQWCAV